MAKKTYEAKTGMDVIAIDCRRDELTVVNQGLGLIKGGVGILSKHLGANDIRCAVFALINEWEEKEMGEKHYEPKEGPNASDIKQIPGGFVSNILPTKAKDSVNHPAHYTTGKMEVIDILKDKLSPDQFQGFLIGNILKYVIRAPHKNGQEDYKKAKWYLERLISE